MKLGEEPEILIADVMREVGDGLGVRGDAVFVTFGSGVNDVGQRTGGVVSRPHEVAGDIEERADHFVVSGGVFGEQQALCPPGDFAAHVDQHGPAGG